jgi:DNA polymerase III gamma/tau subunit
VFQVASEVHDRGLDVKRFADALVERARDLLAAKLVADPKTVLDRPKDEIAELVLRAKSVESAVLERLFVQLSKVVEDVDESAQPRFQLEVGLAAIAEKPERVPVEALLEKLGKVEGMIAAVPPSAGSPVKRLSNDWRAQPRSTPAPYAARLPKAEAVADAGEDQATLAQPGGASPEGGSGPARMYGGGHDIRREPPADFEGEPAAADDVRSGESARAEPASAEIAAARTVASEPARSASSFAGFVELLKRKRPSLAATLAQVRPLRFHAGETELGCETAFDESKLKDPDTRAYLEGLLSEYFGTKTALQVARKEPTSAAAPAVPDADAPPTLNEVEESTREARRSEKGASARSRPGVQAAAEELGATISKVRVIDDT